MQIILKPNDRDKHMIEIWDEHYSMLFAVVYVDLFYALHTKSGEDLWNTLNGGECLVVSLKIDEINPVRVTEAEK